MKKNYVRIAILVLCIGLLSGCTKRIVKIQEDTFAKQVFSIYQDPKEYLDKTIQLEGDYIEVEDKSGTYMYVMREVEMHCEDEHAHEGESCTERGQAGFLINWDGIKPSNDDWVEAIGTIEIYEKEGNQYIQLNVEELNVKEERGAELVRY